MYRRSNYRGRYGKYSNETTCFNFDIDTELAAGVNFPVTQNPDPQQGQIAKGILIVPSTTMQGTRKVKNINLKVVAQGNDSSIVGAIVYVPEGTDPSSLATQLDSQSLYEPNQNVIMSFLIPPSCERDASGDPTHVFSPNTINLSTRLARNLSSGDSIVIIFAAMDAINAKEGSSLLVSGTVNFAIKY